MSNEQSVVFGMGVLRSQLTWRKRVLGSFLGSETRRNMIVTCTYPAVFIYWARGQYSH